MERVRVSSQASLPMMLPSAIATPKSLNMTQCLSGELALVLSEVNGSAAF